MSEKDIAKCWTMKKNDWIPVEERLPEDDKYILVSFSNYPVADIARYEEDDEGGAFYPGDEDVSYISYGIVVNAWQPLPEPYEAERRDAVERESNNL